MEKPLPEVPGPSRLTTLALPSRAHLHRFILKALEEEIISERDEWSAVLEDALQELGTSIARGGWLSGVLRARKARSRRARLAVQHAESARRHSGDDKGKGKERDDKDKGKEREDKGGLLKEPDDGRRLRSRTSHSDLSSEHDVSLRETRPFTCPPRPPHDREGALAALRERISSQPDARPRTNAKHLLLTVEPFGSPLIPDSGFELVRSGINCVFVPSSYSLPTDTSVADDRVLYGLEEWEDLEEGELVQIVGGTFKLRGVESSTQHDSLLKLLRLSLFVYLSLILEQHVLANSHVELDFRRATMPISTTLPVPSHITEEPPHKSRGKPKADTSFTSGLWSFFSKKTENLLTKAASPGPMVQRRGSLELPVAQKMQRASSVGPQPGSTPPRQRRFSFMTGAPPRPPQPPPVLAEELRLASAVKLLERHEALLSTSPGVAFPPPNVLVALAEKERVDPLRRPTGIERAALSSILGWEGANAAQGMAGTLGFVRQQTLSLLYSQHVPLPLAQPMAKDASGPSSLSPPARGGYCGTRRVWATYRYYDFAGGADECLGAVLARMCGDAEERCDKPECLFPRGDHDYRWIHNGMRIVAAVGPSTAPKGQPPPAEDEEEPVHMWEACAVCGKETRRERMLNGTYLFSFAKYLELLLYSPALCELKGAPCAHMTAPRRPWTGRDTPLPPMRMNILRKFAHRARTVTFSLSAIEDIFELQVPRLQITRRRAEKPEGVQGPPVKSTPSMQLSGDEARRTLRVEIRNWWQGLSEHMDQLEDSLVGDEDKRTSYHKSLPRLPSADDAYDFDDDDNLTTPKVHPRALPPDPLYRPSLQPHNSDGSTLTARPSHSDSALSFRPASPHTPVELLSGLRHSFQRTEQALYQELARTPPAALNDARRSFFAAAKGAAKRLSAWEHKHAARLSKGVDYGRIGIPAGPEPEWWKSGCHAVPGGNVIVREDDWGSIIAFTLSSMDYQGELAVMSQPARTTPPSAPPVTPADVPDTRSSFFTAGGASLKRLIGGGAPLPDPDAEGVIWQEPEAVSAVISRKEHPRDPTALMSLREVLRHQNVKGDRELASPAASRLGSPVAAPTRAKPAVEVSMQAAEGNVSGMPEAVEAAGRLLHELEATGGGGSGASSWHSGSDSLSNSGFLETNIRRGKASSIISSDSERTVGLSSPSRSATPPPVPPKGGNLVDSSESGSQTSLELSPTQSSFAMSLTNTLTSAMRYVLRTAELQQIAAQPAHHALLVARTAGDSPAIDDRPHIKYDWTIGKRLRFSCTVYYAKQFDALRKRCGIEHVFLQSLARSENWAAEGGKSKSNFWKTSDDQFIIKTLVNAWNVADLQVLIELGPSYFRYMDATARQPSVLAKLLGFYTVEIRNLETGTTQAKADLLVMENLFYSQKIGKTFDLKGIQGRKVKAAAGASSKTLFDGEWIEGQRRTLTLVRAHSKVVFQEAIKADCEYLARSNIMDYSLLVGINEERREIACGLVDTIGSYTFAKTLEYKAKQGLNSGKEVTVVPPHEYQERFVNAMDDYFLACPDKWSRPQDDTKIPHDYRALPSVI